MNSILYADLDLSDVDRYYALRLHVKEGFGIEVGDTVVVIDRHSGVRCWGPCTDIESSEKRNSSLAITVQLAAAFESVYASS